MVVACCAPAFAQEPLPPPLPLPPVLTDDVAPDPVPPDDAPPDDAAPDDAALDDAALDDAALDDAALDDAALDAAAPDDPAPDEGPLGGMLLKEAPPAQGDPLPAPSGEAGPDEEPAGVDDELPPWDPAVPLWSGAGCLVGGLLGPVLPLGLAIPAAFFVVDNPSVVPVDEPGCASILTVFTCAGLGLAMMAPCSALGATLAAFLAASPQGCAWRALLGGAPGVLCAVLSPLACLCFPIPGGSVLTVIGLALGILGGPLSVAGASLFDARLFERAGAFLLDDDDEGADADDVALRGRRVDQMHY